MSAMTSYLNQRYGALSPRDRRALNVLVWFVLVIGLWLLVWQPSVLMLQKSEASFLQAQSDLAWMHANAPQAKAIAAQAKSSDASKFGAGLFALAGETAQKRGIALARVEPQGDDTLRVAIESVSFTRLLKWLEELKKYGVTTSQLAVDKLSESGKVSATIVFAKP